MAEEATKSRLGRGLAALIGEVGAEAAAPERARGQRRLPVEFIRPNPRNPRRNFADSELAELTASVRERGVIQPILVRPARGSNDNYEIIAGERRWRAAQQAGQHDVPVVVMEASDRESLAIAIVENVQRADLDAIEEALGYEALAGFGHAQDEIARVVGKSRSHVANTLRLLKLPDSVKALVSTGAISAGHARALLTLPDPEAAARAIVEQGLTVRQAEALAQTPSRDADGGGERAPSRRPRGKDADTRALEQRLSDRLGLTVSLRTNGEAGQISVAYRNLEQLDDLIRLLES